MLTCTRRLEFDAAHRLINHEGKCRHLHGHRYTVEITCTASLDAVGRVVDFGVVKEVVGAWLDSELDHGAILHHEDKQLLDLCAENFWKVHVMECNPTVENLAKLIHTKAQQLLSSLGVQVSAVRVYETPNGWADSVV